MKGGPKKAADALSAAFSISGAKISSTARLMDPTWHPGTPIFPLMTGTSVPS